jgi:hypothetical protein
LSPGQVLDALSSDPSEPPREALESADGHRLALVDDLLHAIECGLQDPTGVAAEEAALFAYALYLLGKWRETRAYPYVIRWLSLPGEGAFDIAGDVVTQDGARILAAVCDGNLDPIKALVLDESANEFCRGAGLSALALLAAWAEVPRASVADYLLWLAREGLEREPSHVWNSLAAGSADIEALAAFGEIRRAYDEGLIEPRFMQRSELDQAETAPSGRLLDETRDRYPPIDDVVRATAWWASFAKQHPHTPSEPYRAPRKIGRNGPCPCGSGKKYKKCCGS